MNLYHKNANLRKVDRGGVRFLFFAVFPVHYVNHSALVIELHSRKRLKGGGPHHVVSQQPSASGVRRVGLVMLEKQRVN